MGAKKHDMQARVEARRRAEADWRAPQKPQSLEDRKAEIPDSDLLGYLNENRLGDAKLYCRLHRGSVVYVKYWERFLVLGGHHWVEDDYDMAA